MTFGLKAIKKDFPICGVIISIFHSPLIQLFFASKATASIGSPYMSREDRLRNRKAVKTIYLEQFQ